MDRALFWWDAVAPTQGSTETPKPVVLATAPMQIIVISMEDMATYGVSTKRAHALLAHMRAEMQLASATSLVIGTGATTSSAAVLIGAGIVRIEARVLTGVWDHSMK